MHIETKTFIWGKQNFHLKFGKVRPVIQENKKIYITYLLKIILVWDIPFSFKSTQIAESALRWMVDLIFFFKVQEKEISKSAFSSFPSPLK